MTRIIQGVFDFQQRVFQSKRSLFARLSSGQRPLALFITCSDSRINPNLLTQTEPGELFILRNAGNLVPPADAPPNGEAATVEYAVQQLHVRDIVLCGHSQCGAMAGLVAPEAVTHMPAVAAWLKLGEESIRRAKALHPQTEGPELLQAVIEQNVLVQMEHLQTLPSVRDATEAGRLRLHSWVYGFERGEVTAYDPESRQFIPLSVAHVEKLAVPVAADEADQGDRNI